MDKISRILPSTQRVTTVDLKGSGTSRSGTPSFGREIGVSAMAAKKNGLDTSDLATLKMKEQFDQRKIETDAKAQIIKNMAKDFFVNQQARNEEKFITQPIQEDINTGHQLPLTNSSLEQEVDSNEDVLVSGQYLDVQA